MGKAFVKYFDIKPAIGQRFLYDIFHKDGSIILARGRHVSSDKLSGLIFCDGYVYRKTDSRDSVFSSMTSLSRRLVLVFDDIRDGQDSGVFSRRINMLARDLISLVDQDPDAAFASIHLDIHNPYLVVHSMMAAVVVCRLGLVCGIVQKERISLVCAALTHDLGLLVMGIRFGDKQDLSPEEIGRIRQHVDVTLKVLREFGVIDQTWLEVVRDHHEFLDGSGYHGITAEALSIPSRMMALADTYSAMLRPRPYRDRLLANKALETLYVVETGKYDSGLIESLIWDYGFFPPGSMLRLVSREMAVAIRNTPGLLDSPTIALLTDSNGNNLSELVFRDANDSDYAIAGPLDPALFSRSGHMIENCW